MQTLWIPLPFPGLNEIIEANRKSPFVGAALKKKWSGVVALYARSQGFRPIVAPAHFEIECLEPNRRRNPDNFISGSVKVILDALQTSKLLKNDGWDEILSISPTWKVDKLHPGVRLTVREA